MSADHKLRCSLIVTLLLRQSLIWTLRRWLDFANGPAILMQSYLPQSSDRFFTNLHSPKDNTKLGLSIAFINELRGQFIWGMRSCTPTLIFEMLALAPSTKDHISNRNPACRQKVWRL